MVILWFVCLSFSSSSFLSFLIENLGVGRGGGGLKERRGGGVERKKKEKEKNINE